MYDFILESDQIYLKALKKYVQKMYIKDTLQLILRKRETRLQMITFSKREYGASYSKSRLEKKNPDRYFCTTHKSIITNLSMKSIVLFH